MFSFKETDFMVNFQIETAQNVNISQQFAGVGHRIIAFIIDGLIIAAYMLSMSFVFSQLDMFDDFSIVVGATIGLPPFFYHLLWESLWNGRSPGKAALQLKVVKLDGTKPALSNYMIRWVLRLIDVTICSGAVALFAILLNGKGQRLGDIAAQTTVISERDTIQLFRTLLVEVPENYIPTYSQVTLFSDTEMQTIKNMYQDAKAKGNHNIILKLSEQVSKVMQITSEETPMVFLESVIKDYNYYTQKS